VRRIVAGIEELESCHKFVGNWNDIYVPKGFYSIHEWEDNLASIPISFPNMCGLHTSCPSYMRPYENGIFHGGAYVLQLRFPMLVLNIECHPN